MTYLDNEFTTVESRPILSYYSSSYFTCFDSNEYFYFTASVCGIRIAYGAGRAGQKKADQQ